MNNRYCVVDVETTGLSPKQNRVIDIGIVVVDKGKIVDTWESLINPLVEIPKYITYYTGITDEMVQTGVLFEDVYHKLKSFMQNSIFVAHNVSFDYSFLEQEMARIEKPFVYPKLCTVTYSRKMNKSFERHSLDYLIDKYNIQVENRHRALPDALATAQILIDLLQRDVEKNQLTL